MTPIIKAFLTDTGFEVANLGLQIYGGHGYIREWGMEQFVRDARIAQIYEGTNGVQADGPHRPQGARGERPAHAPLPQARAGRRQGGRGRPELAELAKPLGEACARCRRR
jgi:hypothetical protein